MNSQYLKKSVYCIMNRVLLNLSVFRNYIFDVGRGGKEFL